MRQYTLLDNLFDAIENCASVEWIIKEITQHKEELSKEQILKILNYYLSFKK